MTSTVLGDDAGDVQDGANKCSYGNINILVMAHYQLWHISDDLYGSAWHISYCNILVMAHQL